MAARSDKPPIKEPRSFIDPPPGRFWSELYSAVIDGIRRHGHAAVRVILVGLAIIFIMVFGLLVFRIAGSGSSDHSLPSLPLILRQLSTVEPSATEDAIWVEDERFAMPADMWVRSTSLYSENPLRRMGRLMAVCLFMLGQLGSEECRAAVRGLRGRSRPGLRSRWRRSRFKRAVNVVPGHAARLVADPYLRIRAALFDSTVRLT